MICTRPIFCFCSILHVILKDMPRTPHRRSLLSAARSSSIARHLARSRTVHVESCDTMRSRKAQCQAPPDNPKPEIHTTVENAEAALAGKQRQTNASGTAQQCGYVYIQARLTSTNPGSIEETCEYGLPLGTCFVVRRLELVVVGGRLWISWRVLGWADFDGFFWFLMRPFFAFTPSLFQASIFGGGGSDQETFVFGSGNVIIRDGLRAKKSLHNEAVFCL